MNSSYFCSVCGASIKRTQKQTAVVQRTPNFTESVCENDHICQSCCKLAVQSYKQSKNNVTLDMEVFEENKQSFNGTCSKNKDNNVCLICSTSLSNRQGLLVIKPDPTELDQIMLNLIMDAITPQTKIGSEDKVCSKCWFITRKSAIHLQQLELNGIEDENIEDENESIEIISEPESEHSENLIVEIEEQHSEETEEEEENNESEYKDDSDDPDFTVKYITNIKTNNKSNAQKNLAEEILLPNYNRISCSSRPCTFKNCKDRERRRIPTQIREKMLIDYKLYIPTKNRVCEKHLNSNNWDDLHRTSSILNNKYTFNANQIEDMFSMVKMKNSTDLDFHNTILDYDDYLIEYFLGIKRETLTNILTKEPKIKNMCNGFIGLLGLLLKHENGGPDNRIISLLNIPKSTLRRSMDEVKKLLLRSQVTKEFGLEYLLK